MPRIETEDAQHLSIIGKKNPHYFSLHISYDDRGNALGECGYYLDDLTKEQKKAIDPVLKAKIKAHTGVDCDE